MPQTSPDKWKALFADLGRPTLRGIRKCPKCGTINGTRGNSCKNKSCDVVFRDNGLKKKAFTDACKIVSPDYPCEQTFSVRLRDRGPDYRNFVQIPLIDTHSETVVTISDCTADISVSSQKCFVESCNTKGREFPCPHLLAAQKCFADSQPLPIKHSILPSLNIPEENKEVINLCLVDNSDTLVQRVSNTSFVVRCDVSQRHPLGLLHIMFFKPNKYESSDKRFLCVCRPYKQNRDDPLTSNGNNGFEPSNKYCIHYYACICAFASNDLLASEFDFVLSQVANEYTPTLLSQLHLVTTLPSNSNRDIESLDPNQISVEIMRENISLLESIAAADDTSLPNVQGLEGVLADQIIVTNVDDGFGLGDSTLDDLGEADQQVCQIFSSNQSIQLQSTYSETTDVLVSSGIPSKRRKDDSDKGVHDSGPTGQDSMNSVGMTVDKPVMGRKNIAIRPANTKTVMPQIAIIGTVALNPTPSNHVPCMERKTPVLGFEEWLAGINERINLLMNYQLPGNPEPLVCMVFHDFFECLKDRITAGFKKKRLPNQTAIIQRLDASPRKNFTKHVWKITNLVQLLHIFSCSLVPLKPTQYFIKTGNGVYEEWTNSSKEADEIVSKNQPIAPILHSTYIRIGRSDQCSKEKDWASFIIEWIPDLWPASRQGELTLRFEFGHASPKLNTC